MDVKKAQIIFVEDQPDEARRVTGLLDAANGPGYKIEVVDRLGTALTLLQQRSFTLAILDFHQPDVRSIDAITRMGKTFQELPLIVLLDVQSQDLAQKALEAGAQDYLFKTELTTASLLRSIRYAIERKRTQVALRAAEERHALAVQAGRVGIWDWDLLSGAGYLDPHFKKHMGFEPDQLDDSREAWLGRVHPADRQKVSEALDAHLNGVTPVFEIEHRKLHMDGSIHWYLTRGTAMWNDAGVAVRLSGTDTEITDRVLAEEQLRLAGSVFESTAEGIFVTNDRSEIVSVNKAFSDITGYSADEVMGQNIHNFHTDQRDQDFFHQLWSSLEITGRWQGEIWNRRKDGEVYPEWLTISTVRDSHGRVTHLMGVFTDITFRKQAEENLRYLATHDPLTALPNRDLFRDRLNHVLERARRSSTNAAVMLIDLDHFKNVNDSVGHMKGDLILQSVAESLRSSLRESDTVARIGGDEFTVILEEISTLQDAAIVAQKLLQSLDRTFILDDRPFSITASIGISMYPENGQEPDTLLKNADIAMYRAKEVRNRYEFFSRMKEF